MSPDSQSPPALFSLAILTTGIRNRSGLFPAALEDDATLHSYSYQSNATSTGAPSITATRGRLPADSSPEGCLNRSTSWCRKDAGGICDSFCAINGMYCFLASAAISEGFGFVGGILPQHTTPLTGQTRYRTLKRTMRIHLAKQTASMVKH